MTWHVSPATTTTKTIPQCKTYLARLAAQNSYSAALDSAAQRSVDGRHAQPQPRCSGSRHAAAEQRIEMRGAHGR
jgi:hypothetical protein